MPALSLPDRQRFLFRSEIRRSSRIQSMVQTHDYDESMDVDRDFVLPSDGTSDDEDEHEKLVSAFTTKIDTTWQASCPVKVSKRPARPARQAARVVGTGVKIFEPNIGLKASTVGSSHSTSKSCVSRKMNVAISSSDEDLIFMQNI